MLTIIPTNIIKAVTEPYLTKAMATTASLLGTTPCTCKANLNILAKGVKALLKIPAPPVSTKKPTKVLIPP